MLVERQVLTDDHRAFRADVIAGLSTPQKTLPSWWLYDDRGSELFEEITKLEEYYPTRTETGILRAHAAEMAAFAGSRVALLEYGAGAGIKTEILIEALDQPRLYMPIDIAGDFVRETASRIGERFPRLETWPLVADFTQTFDIPKAVPHPRVGFFPGSTIGNLDETECAAFLNQMSRHAGPAGTAIVGVDLRKDLDRLIAAYDDRLGVTAEFNLNLLVRINRELRADFALDQFVHSARWNPAASAIEMHLVSQSAQSVAIDGWRFDFQPGETIHTESSRKYDLAAFAETAAASGWSLEKVWTDPEQLFAVCGLRSL
jgi:dimethylhistidine N-methyltransferase